MKKLKPLARALGEIALALLAVGLTAALTRLALLPLLQSLSGLDDEVMAYIRRGSMLVAFVLGYWLYVRLVERRPARELSASPVVVGVTGLGGAALIGLPIAILYLTGTYRVVSIGTIDGMAGVAMIVMAAAVLEEIVFRGIAFGIVERHFGTWIAMIVPTLVFSLLHIFNGNWGGWISLLSGTLIGGVWTLTYALTRNIWAVALNHALWNYTIFATGLPLTGIQEWRQYAPLHSEFQGPSWWSGGLAGPEDTVMVLLVAIPAVAVLLAVTIRRGLIKPYPAPEAHPARPAE